MESEFDQRLIKLREQFQLKEKELEEIQTRFVPQMDTDVLRLKMLSELEGPHRKELESKQALIDEQATNLFTLKRKYEDLRADSESNRVF